MTFYDRPVKIKTVCLSRTSPGVTFVLLASYLLHFVYISSIIESVPKRDIVIILR